MIHGLCVGFWKALPVVLLQEVSLSTVTQYLGPWVRYHETESCRTTGPPALKDSALLLLICDFRHCLTVQYI